MVRFPGKSPPCAANAFIPFVRLMLAAQVKTITINCGLAPRALDSLTLRVDFLPVVT